MSTVRNNSGSTTRGSNGKYATIALCNTCGATREATVGPKAHLVGKVGEAPTSAGWNAQQKYRIGTGSKVLQDHSIDDFERMTSLMKCVPCNGKTRHSMLLPEGFPSRDKAETFNAPVAPAAGEIEDHRELSGRGWDTAETWSGLLVNLRIVYGDFDDAVIFESSLDPVVAWNEGDGDHEPGWVLWFEDVYGERWTSSLSEEIYQVGSAINKAQKVIEQYRHTVAVGPVRD